MNFGHRINKRDRHGWRVPREGTLSRRIYDLTVAGQVPKTIAEQLDVDVGMVRVLAHRFRNPDLCNAWRKLKP